MDWVTRNLHCKPFEEQPAPAFFFEAVGHMRALCALKDGIAQGKPLLLLSGPAGVGKSLLARCLLAKLDPAVDVKLITGEHADPRTLTERVGEAFAVAGASCTAAADMAAELRSASTLRRVLIVDDAEHLPATARAEIETLTECDETGRPAVQFVLVGPEESGWVSASLSQLAGHSTPTATLNRLDGDEVAAYVRHRLAVAGGTTDLPFAEDALRVIADRTSGSPRAINRLCRYLLAADSRRNCSEKINAKRASRAPLDMDTPASQLGFDISERVRSEGSHDMADANVTQSFDAADPAGVVKNRVRSAGTGQLHANTEHLAARHDPALASLIERLEGVLNRAPTILESFENAGAKSEDVLSRVEALVRAVDQHDRSVQRHATGLEKSAAKAEQLQLNLSEFASQLADVGDTSQQKIRLLLDGLDAGNRTQRELAEMTDRAADVMARLDSKVAESEKRLSDLGERQTRRLAEAAGDRERHHAGLTEDLVATLERTQERGLSELRQKIKNTERRQDEALAGFEKRIEEQLAPIAGVVAKHEQRIVQTAEKCVESVDRLQQEAQAAFQKRIVEQLAPIAGVVAKQEQRIVQTAQKCAESVDRLQQEALSRIEKRIDEQLATIAGTVAKHEQRIVQMAEKCAENVDRLQQEALSRIEKELRERTAAFGEDGAYAAQIKELVSTCTSKLNTIFEDQRRILTDMIGGQQGHFELEVQQQENKLVQTADACSQSLVETKDQMLLDIQKEIEQLAAPYSADGEHLTQIKDLIERGVTNIETLTEHSKQAVSQAAERNLVELGKVVDVKAQQLASHTNASREVIRTVSDATQSGHDVLNQLLENKGLSESRLRTLTEECDRADSVAQRLGELREQSEPSIAAVRDTLEGSHATVEKIERLIQDVWTLTTTAQDRARQLGERCEGTDALIQKIRDAQKEADTSIANLAGKNLTARQRMDELGKAFKQCEDAIERTDAACVSTVESAASLTEIAERTKTEREKTIQSIERGEQVLNRAAAAVEKVEACTERVVGETRSAEQITGELDTAAKGVAETIKRVEAIRSVISTTADDMAAAVKRAEAGKTDANESLARGCHLKESLETVTRRADEAARELAQLLATMTERREILESSDHTLNAFVERAEAVRVKLQQLQTRSDSYQHQLNSMLANPQKIVDEAKAQADQLNNVCRAVRKVFSGLSQTSLQANRDISRFAEISREANGKLTQISAETNRAAQTLREWINEASHAQSRLSKSLAQVPPLDQTHPSIVLEDLARASSDPLPSVLRPGAGRRPIDRLSEQREKSGSGKSEKANGKTDFATLILEAERVAEGAV